MGIRMSRLESAIRIVLEFSEAFNRHDVAAMMRLMSDDCILEDAGPAPDGAVYSGKEAVARFWQGFFRTSPYAHIEIEEIFGLGVRCVIRWRYDWVDMAEGKRHIRGVSIFKVRGGSICEMLSYVKGLSVLENFRSKAAMRALQQTMDHGGRMTDDV